MVRPAGELVLRVGSAVYSLRGICSGPRLRWPVSSDRPVLSVPLFPQAEWIQPQWAIYGEHAVEVIDLVLE